MTKEELIEFEKDLKQNGYNEYYFYNNADSNYFKSFGKNKNKYEEGRSLYQVAFSIYDYSKYNNINLKDNPVNIQPTIMISRTINERIDLEITLHNNVNIKRIEELAESLYKWVEIQIPINETS